MAFQLPVVMLLANWVGVVDRRTFAPYRKHAAFTCAITGALLTPADPASMILLMIPLYLLFEFGMVLMRFVTPARVARGFGDEKEPADAGDE